MQIGIRSSLAALMAIVLVACGEGSRTAGAHDAGVSTTVYFDRVYAAPGSLYTVLAKGIPALAPQRWALAVKPGGGLALTLVLMEDGAPVEFTFTLDEGGGVLELALDAITTTRPLAGDPEQVRRAWLAVVERRVVTPLDAHTVR